MENKSESMGAKKRIKIELATSEDVRGMQDVFYKSWLATYPNKEHGITVDDVEDRFKDLFTEEVLAKRAKRIINPPEGETLFFAKEGDKIVGLCRVVKSKKNNRILAIYVLPKYQGQRVGKLLWKEAQKYIDPEKDTLLSVATYNSNAINFYKSLGFEDTGKKFTEERLRMKSGAVIPEMEMELKGKKNFP
ncbi:MAG: GNAT family N-acetyltransferase [Nitrospinae bacterium]|nr:GNAT family N-acetyltransferase [Nitrospinota bacterium]